MRGDLNFQDSFIRDKLRPKIFVVNCLSQHFCMSCGWSWAWSWENVDRHEGGWGVSSLLKHK